MGRLSTIFSSTKTTEVTIDHRLEWLHIEGEQKEGGERKKNDIYPLLFPLTLCSEYVISLWSMVTSTLSATCRRSSSVVHCEQKNMITSQNGIHIKGLSDKIHRPIEDLQCTMHHIHHPGPGPPRQRLDELPCSRHTTFHSY